MSHAAIFAIALLSAAACSERSPLAPRSRPTAPQLALAAAPPSVRFSEIHYDNTGTDAGEAIEISGPAGTDLTGWSIVLYNGSNGAAYDTKTLTGTIPATCGTRGVVVTNYPSNGIQNGSPDGMALVSPTGLVEFLSYEGTLAGVGGPADGVTSVDIGVSEVGTESASPVTSLGRDAAGAWSGPTPNTFGACNDADETPPNPVASVTVTPNPASTTVGGTAAFTAQAFDASSAPVAGVIFTWTSANAAVATVSAAGVATGIALGDVQITATAPNGIAGSATLHVIEAAPPSNVHLSEIHYDNSGTDAGEAIEVEGPAGADLTGWSVVLYNGNGGASYNTQPLTGALPNACSGRGVMVVSYPSNGIQNGGTGTPEPDGFALVDGTGHVVEFLSYEGTFAATGGPAAGLTSTDIGVDEEPAPPAGLSLQRSPAGTWFGPNTNTFGACNGDEPPPPPSNITFTGRFSSDPPLPIGYEDQLFATLRDGTGATVPSTFTWVAETPSIATIDQAGVMHAVAEGTATFRATAMTDGTTGTISLPMAVATLSTTALYANNTEFGEPADGNPSDDFLVRRLEFTTSYNATKGTPNWVSYDLEASHFGSNVDRCDCFTFDPELPASFTHLNTNDYTGAGAAAGFGIDRGHLARSFDRTAGALDNATTYLMSNIIPQASDLNQGPWAIMENFLGDQARNQNKEVYIIAGPAGNKGTVKGEGKIVIPTQVWKVAVIMPHDQGLADVHTLQDLEVIAVIMPNDPGVRNVDWNTYRTTVDAVEAMSGYDLLALLPDGIEAAVESGSRVPTAVADGPYAGSEGGSVAMSGAGSSDPDAEALTFAWSFGDGGSANGASVSHTYVQDGSYAVRLIVTDVVGLADTVVTTAAIGNVAPVIGAFAGATLLPDESYSAPGSFVDPGADTWSATVNYGDGSGTNPLALQGEAFALAHVFDTPGVRTVTVRVADDDATGERTATVTVLTAQQAIGVASDMVDQLVEDGKLSVANGNTLQDRLDAALRALNKGRTAEAVANLVAVNVQLDVWAVLRRISLADSAPLRQFVRRIILAVT